MAFTFSKTYEAVEGNLRHTFGTFTTSSTDTTGDVYTGLQKVFGIVMTPKNAAGAQCYTTTTFPAVDPVTIVFSASSDGYWHAFGA